MSLSVVISGGQTGADQAGVIAGKKAGLTTGGYAPKGWITEDGPAPWLADYGLVENLSPSFAARTEANVRYADATILVAQDLASQGAKLTKRLIDDLHKPSHTVFYLTENMAGLLAFLRENDVQVLNVAGNRESVTPGIYLWTVRFLVRAFGLLRN